MFNVEDVLASLDSSFQQSGAEDFRAFLLKHAHIDRWIVASDFNIGTKGCAQDVYSFVCYPNTQGISDLCKSITHVIPYDFKETRRITREQERFMARGECFCFVFMVPRPRRLLRRTRPAQDLERIRRLLAETQDLIKGLSESHRNLFAKLVAASKRNGFSLDHCESLLLLCAFHAFVSGKICFNSPTHLIGWFPDRDRMTTSYQGCWSAVAFMMLQSYWHRTMGTRPMPEVSVIDHRVKSPGLINNLLDPLIRVPDFFSAVLSRWDRERRVVSRPPDAQPGAMGRYIKIMAAWLPENSNVWLSVMRFREEGLTTHRIVSARTPRRLRRYAQR